MNEKYKKLLDHLSMMNKGAGLDPAMERDMLSLIVSGSLNEENIAERYPSFYKKLLENPELRQAFLDALESVEAERAGKLTPIPDSSRTKPNFLKKPSTSPQIEMLDGRNWRAFLQRSIEHLKVIFSPPEMAYRDDPVLADDPWFTLLRDEMVVEGVTYDIVLDCVLSHEREGALSPYLHLAVTIGRPGSHAGLPLRASLRWGNYQESITVENEGRFQFPDIPLAAVFDQAEFQLQSGLDLTLETTS